jgi:hypothetical protein
VIQPGAIVCRHCGRQIPSGLIKVAQIGGRYMIGEFAREQGTSVGVWDIANGSAFLGGYPTTERGWNQAWRWFQQSEAEHAKELARKSRKGFPRWAWAVVVIVLLVAVYWGYHEYRYRNCLIKPDIASWPSVCF